MTFQHTDVVQQAAENNRMIFIKLTGLGHSGAMNRLCGVVRLTASWTGTT